MVPSYQFVRTRARLALNVFGRKKDSTPPPAVDPDRRALYEELAQRPDTVCPFLGLADSRVAYVDVPTEEHRCYAYEDVSPLSGDQQRNVCLQRGYANCPRYLRGVLVIPSEELAALRRHVSAPVTPAAPAPKPAARPARKSRRPLVAGVLALIVLAGGAWLLFGRGSGVPAPTATPTPSANVGSPTPEGSPSSAGSPSPTPQPTPIIITGDGFVLVGDAANGGERAFMLTASRLNELGAAWPESTIVVTDGFRLSFSFALRNPLAEGGDGISVVIHDSGSQALFGPGGGMGYAAMPNSLAIEFDTFRNPDLNDPNDNHISIHTNGTGLNSASETFSIGTVTDIANISDGEVHEALISYRPGTLEVYLDDMATPVLSVAVNLSQRLALDEGRAWVGIAGSTGFTAQEQWIFLVSLEDSGVQ